MGLKSKVSYLNTKINSMGYSDCIRDTVLDLKDFRWYLGYKLHKPINFNSNQLRVNTLKLETLLIMFLRS